MANPEIGPHLFENELSLFTEQFQGVEIYLEYGMGGSTIYAAESGVKTIVSIDTNPEWVYRVADKVHTACKDAELIHCDLGPIGDWGYPKTKERITEWPSYFMRPWQTLLSRNAIPSLIYVDGRFRLTCMLYSILILHGLNENSTKTKIMIHDYIDRSYYHSVERYASIISSANTLAVLRPKPDINFQSLLSDLLISQFDLR